jgi:hypothetical protein
VTGGIDPKVLGKIKKCLALSRSNNPNEAATALRQAHALMAKHGVSSHEVVMSDIGEGEAISRTMARDKPAEWEMRLAAKVGKAFGCRMLVSKHVLRNGRGHLNEGRYVFIGLKDKAEIAAYTATVLIRKCKSARQQWLTEHLGGIGTGVKGMKAKKTRMGDAFAEGWVNAISKLVVEFANPSGVETAIERYVQEQTSGGVAEGRGLRAEDIGNHELAAAMMGQKAAEGERLFRPMEGSPAPLALDALG